jgi:hypothetical protein
MELAQVLEVYSRRLVMVQQVQVLYTLLQVTNLAILFSQLILEISQLISEIEDLRSLLHDYVSRIGLAGACIGHIAHCAMSDTVVAAFFVLVTGELSTLERKQLVFGQ